MIIKHSFDIDEEVISTNLRKLINHVYKLLPSREEGLNWELPLNNIISEFAGMNKLLTDYQHIIFPLLCKLQGLSEEPVKSNFKMFRSTIFDCINMISILNDSILKGDEKNDKN